MTDKTDCSLTTRGRCLVRGARLNSSPADPQQNVDDSSHRKRGLGMLRSSELHATTGRLNFSCSSAPKTEATSFEATQ